MGDTGEIMDSDILIKLRSYACLDYSVLENVFSDYAKPIDKILRLVKQGDLIRIKKGLWSTDFFHHIARAMEINA